MPDLDNYNKNNYYRVFSSIDIVFKLVEGEDWYNGFFVVIQCRVLIGFIIEELTENLGFFFFIFFLCKNA